MGLVKEGNSSVTPQNNTSNLTPPGQTYAGSPYEGGDAKSRQIKVSGVIQAAVQASVLQMFVTNHDEWWHLVEKTADSMLAYIERKSK